MCGIMGYVGKRPVTEVLLKGLKRLEYRGYDSAGLGVFKAEAGEPSGVEILKSSGKLSNVETLVQKNSVNLAACGIGHTRWATHGSPTTLNAHPHQAGPIVIVHNGIVENFREIREELVASGYSPQSETDSELIAFLIWDGKKKGKSLREATRSAFKKIRGSCSVVAMSEEEPGTLVGVRQGSPLVAARDMAKPNGEGGLFLASDAQAVLEYTKDVLFLENGELAEIRSAGQEIRFYSLEDGKEITRDPVRLDWTEDQMDKKGFAHYMLKEIHEQPTAWVDTLNASLDRQSARAFDLKKSSALELLQQSKRVVFVACGTSWHAALLGKYWFEKWAKRPVAVELSSEFRYREPVLEEGTLVIALSQSGETADTLSVVREMKRRGVPTLVLTNVPNSTLSREADAALYTVAGPEIGVAATKTFTSQMIAIFLWALSLRTSEEGPENFSELQEQVIRLPHEVDQVLNAESLFGETISAVAEKTVNAKGFFFIGRGTSFSVALEGALKLKEIAYIHAEGYAGGELKHGPIAMIDEGMVVVVLAPNDHWYEKTVSNLQEVKARGARIIAIADEENEVLKKQIQEWGDEWIPMPSSGSPNDSLLSPFWLTLVVQLLSYRIAVLRGTDVDQPRNLAKSVTVE